MNILIIDAQGGGKALVSAARRIIIHILLGRTSSALLPYDIKQSFCNIRHIG